jgi:hypothetical protein
MFPLVLRHHPSTFHSSTDSIASEDYLYYRSQIFTGIYSWEFRVVSGELGGDWLK